MTTIHELYDLLSRYKFSVNNEKATQVEIQSILNEKKIVHAREYFLDEDSIPDFMVDNIAIEVKIGGNKRDIYRQILRYSQHEDVGAVLLVTNRAIGKAPLYDNKPLKILNLGRAHL